MDKNIKKKIAHFDEFGELVVIRNELILNYNNEKKEIKEQNIDHG